jgi:hypothetical protein
MGLPSRVVRTPLEPGVGCQMSFLQLGLQFWPGMSSPFPRPERGENDQRV